TVESKRVFANVGVNEECDFGVKFVERGVRGEWNSDDIADTTDIHENLIGAFVSEPAAKLSDHRMPVLPLFVRPSTFERVCVYGGEKGTTPVLRTAAQWFAELGHSPFNARNLFLRVLNQDQVGR